MHVHSTFYSALSTPLEQRELVSEPHSVERRLSFAVEVTTASGNLKHPLPLKIIFSARFQWLLCFRNGRLLTLPTLRNPGTALLKCDLTYRIYIYKMYL